MTAVASSLATWGSIARPHILAIVFASTLTYGFIFTGEHSLLIPALAVWDWFIVNFANKAVDVQEDLGNGIPGAELVGRNKRTVELVAFAMILFGLGAGVFLAPRLTPFRVLFTLIGLAYNYRLIPWPGGRTRLKEMYFFKNFGSSMLFTLSVFIYPLVGLGADYPLDKLLVAILFFIPLELTYEIFYDLRDVQGDRAEGVPTYPVVHGERTARRIAYALIGFSAIFPIAGALWFDLLFREWCVVAACVQQALLFFWFTRRNRRPSHGDAVAITLIGAAQLASYNLWVLAGLPL